MSQLNKNNVMYIIVNTDLDMSVGKIAAQVAHAAQHIMDKINNLQDSNIIYYEENEKAMLDQYFDWKLNLERIVVLKANIKQFNKVIEEYKDQCYIQVDAGLNQVSAGTQTVIALHPMEKPKNGILKKLQCL